MQAKNRKISWAEGNKDFITDTILVNDSKLSEFPKIIPEKELAYF